MNIRRGQAPRSLEQPRLEVFEVQCLVRAVAVVTVCAYGRHEAMEKAERACERSDIVELVEVSAHDVRPPKSDAGLGQP